MRLFAILLLILFCPELSAQPTTVSILGRVDFEYTSDHYIIDFDENFSNQAHQLLDSLALDFAIQDSVYMGNSFSRIHVYDLEDFDFLRNIFLKNKLRFNAKYYYPDHDYEAEDQKAILAIRDAESKVEIIAQKLGMKVRGILNIDDKVKPIDFYPELRITSPCSEDLFQQLLGMLSSRSQKVGNEKSVSAVSSVYAIWVTFELTE